MILSSFVRLSASWFLAVYISFPSEKLSENYKDENLILKHNFYTLVDSNTAVAKGIMDKKMLIACLGTRKALSSALLLARYRCLSK